MDPQNEKSFKPKTRPPKLGRKTEDKNMAAVDIDINAISAEVDKLSEEDLRKMVLDSKVRQRVATKKYYNPEAAKAQRQKRAEMVKAAEAKLKELGLYDDLESEIKQAVDAKLAEEEIEA